MLLESVIFNATLVAAPLPCNANAVASPSEAVPLKVIAANDETVISQLFNLMLKGIRPVSSPFLVN